MCFGHSALSNLRSFWCFFWENHIFLPRVKNFLLKIYFQKALVQKQFDKNAWNQLKMVTNIPDLPILKMLIKIFGYFWVIQVWSVGPLRASLFPSDMSISTSLSLSCCRFEMQVSTLQSRTFFKCIQLSKKRNTLNLGSTLALNQQFQCFLLYFLSTIGTTFFQRPIVT